MKISRRSILTASALLGGSTLLSGCDKVISAASDRFHDWIPERISVPSNQEIDPAFHLLSRAAYGPWPGDIDRVKEMGIEKWIDEQLDYEQIDDTWCRLRARRFESLYLKPGDCYDFKKEKLREDITRHTLLNAIYSQRQLFEVMVGFWSDHLNINVEKGDCIYLKAADDMTVVRPHALGNFKEMLRASALSPAMLVYLDGKENKKGSPKDIPNENYARELMELHTLGVDGGYTQRDVFEAARCLTGWRLREQFGKGTVFFDPELHDDGEKIVLGKKIVGGGGERDVDSLVDIVCEHPSTAGYIATKLVRYFVSDEAAPALVARVKEQFMRTNFDIKPAVRTILLSEEFKNARGTKFKRPFRFVVSALRAVGADTHAKDELIEYLNRMGQGPFQYPTPDGYPTEMLPWLGTLLWRWNFALALGSNEVPNVTTRGEKLADAIAAGRDATVMKEGPGRPGNRSAALPLHLVVSYLIGRAPTEAEKLIFSQVLKAPDRPRTAGDIAGDISSSTKGRIDPRSDTNTKSGAKFGDGTTSSIGLDTVSGTTAALLVGLVIASPSFQRH